MTQCPQEVQAGDAAYLLLPRHGASQQVAPHEINYRANVWLMHSLGVTHLLGTHTVGAIDPVLGVGRMVLPDQLIDYTWGRSSTYDDERRHVMFETPYCASLRDAVRRVAPRVVDTGVYGCTQGPRLETAAEIRRMARDGCTVVGMTGMPEAVLARELELCYASLCVIVNPAAGVGEERIDGAAIRAASDVGGRAFSAVADLLAARLCQGLV